MISHSNTMEDVSWNIHYIIRDEHMDDAHDTWSEFHMRVRILDNPAIPGRLAHMHQTTGSYGIPHRAKPCCPA